MIVNRFEKYIVPSTFSTGVRKLGVGGNRKVCVGDEEGRRREEQNGPRTLELSSEQSDISIREIE